MSLYLSLRKNLLTLAGSHRNELFAGTGMCYLFAVCQPCLLSSRVTGCFTSLLSSPLDGCSFPTYYYYSPFIPGFNKQTIMTIGSPSVNIRKEWNKDYSDETKSWILTRILLKRAPRDLGKSQRSGFGPAKIMPQLIVTQLRGKWVRGVETLCCTPLPGEGGGRDGEWLVSGFLR